MRNRVEPLKRALPDIKDRLVQAESKIERIEHSMAKMANRVEARKDIEDLKTLINKEFTSHTRWFFGMSIAVTCISIAAARWIP